MNQQSGRTDAPVRDTTRKFAVSSNRNAASHRIRYVEMGGAAVDVDECVFCETFPGASDEKTSERSSEQAKASDPNT